MGGSSPFLGSDDSASRQGAIADQVSSFYERHPYPPPIDDLEAYRAAWNEARRRAESHLFWPAQTYRADRSVLIAGCGTVQAAHYALRWPRARVVGIDVSESSIAFGASLREKHGLENLELRKLPIEEASTLGESFDLVVCTGVLHHLADPEAGLRALRAVMNIEAALHLMVYAPYGRAGVYMLQAYCRALGVEQSERGIDDLAAALRALPPDHPIVPLLRNSPDFASKAALADALLHPQDRAYSVPQLFDFLEGAELRFGRWVRQAPYLPGCGALATSPHSAALAALPPLERYAAIELFRGTMVRHTAIAYRSDLDARTTSIDFTGRRWEAFVPIRLPDTMTVRERLPQGAAAVLINRNHTYTDLYLPIDARCERMLSQIDGRRSIDQIARAPEDRAVAKDFISRLWEYDQIVLDASPASE